MPKKLLVIRLSAMGDIVFTTALLRALKQQAGCQITYLLKKQYAQLLENNPYVDHLELFDGDLDDTIDRLRSMGFDGVIDLHNNIRSRKICSKLGKKVYRINKHSFDKYLKIYLNIDRLPKTHVAERCFETVKELNIKNDGQGMDFFFPSDFEFKIPPQISSKYITLVLGATHKTKRIPFSTLDALLNQVDCPVVLIGGKDVVETAEKLAKAKRQITVINQVGKLDLIESAAVIKQSAVVLAGDTGMMHIAAALKKPIVSVWGSTIPEFGVFPYYGEQDINHQIIEKKMSCRPCSKHGKSECPKGHFKCMNDIEVKEISTPLNKFLRN